MCGGERGVPHRVAGDDDARGGGGRVEVDGHRPRLRHRQLARRGEGGRQLPRRGAHRRAVGQPADAERGDREQQGEEGEGDAHLEERVAAPRSVRERPSG